MVGPCHMDPSVVGLWWVPLPPPSPRRVGKGAAGPLRVLLLLLLL